MRDLDALARERQERGDLTETERILGLVASQPDAERCAAGWTRLLSQPRGTMKLLPAQGACLESLFQQESPRGLVGALGVGEGKTLVSLLAPTVVAWAQAQTYRPQAPVSKVRHTAANLLTTLLLVPSALVDKTRTEAAEYGKHFAIAQQLTVMGYGKLSTPAASRILSRMRPHILVVDEAHYLANPASARTKRVLAYLRERPETRVVLLSGTLTRRSLLDCGHLLEAALREGSPLPRHRSDLEQWASVVDRDGTPGPTDVAAMAPIVAKFTARAERTGDGRQNARLALQRLYAETKGLVMSAGTTCGASLRLHRSTAELSRQIEQAMRGVQRAWELPDGSELSLAVDFARHCRTLSLGFYNVWEWPEGVVDEDWLAARRAWGGAVRAFLQYSSRSGLDSPALVERAAESGLLSPRMTVTWRTWCAERHKPEPPTVSRWVDREWLGRVVASWRKTAGGPGLIWYRSRAVGERLAETGLPVHGAGSKAPEPGQTVAVSIPVWGTGWNGQAWSRSLVLEPPANGATWEQMLGRTHRHGQTDDVKVWALAHTDAFTRAIDKATEEARYVRETTNQPQRLLFADRVPFMIDTSRA